MLSPESLKHERLSSKTLFICTSPFQAYLVERMITNFKIKPIVIVFVGKRTIAIETYIERLKLLSSRVYKIEVENKTTAQIIPKVECIIWRVRYRVNSLMIASINTFYPIWIANRLKENPLFLFDDGTLSIIEEKERAKYTKGAHYKGIKRIILKLAGINQTYETLISRSVCFFTIFPEIQTITDSGKVFSITNILYSSQVYPLVLSPLKSSLCLYIGDVESELTTVAKEIDEQLYSLNEVDYHIPHPRGLCGRGPKSLSMNTVAEEFIMGLLAYGIRLDIVSLESTVLFTLPKHTNLRRFMVISFGQQLPSLRKYVKQFNIDMVTFDQVKNLLCTRPGDTQPRGT
jgi:hypothetical protein